MKKLVATLTAALSAVWLFGAVPVAAQTTSAVVVAACGTPPTTYAAGQNRQVTQDTTGRVCQGATISGTASENLAQVNGATVNVGAGAAGTGTQRVTTSTDSTIGTVTAVTAITNALPAGTAILGKVGIDQTTPGTTNGTVPAGNVASGAADSGNPLKIGCKYNSSLPTFSDGNRGDCQVDSRGNTRVVISDTNGSNGAAVAVPANGASLTAALKTIAFPVLYNGTTADLATGDTNGMVVQNWATNGNRWSFAPATGGIVNTTTAVTIKAAAGASVRNYIDSCQIDHDLLGAVTELVIRDGAAGTVLWRHKLQTAAQESGTYNFDSPLRGTANTLVEVATLTAVTGGVFVNCQGHSGS